MSEEKLTSVLLTQEEVGIIQEALESWAKAIQHESAFAGLIASAMVSKDTPGESDQGKELRKMFTESGEAEAKRRSAMAYKILAKILS